MSGPGPLVGLLQQGGPVLTLLLLLSCWMWWLILLKSWQLWRLRQLELPLDLCLLRLRRGEPLAGWQGELLARAAGVERSRWRTLGAQVTATMERHLGTILVLAQVAPLLGLIGTVIGMIAAFDALARFGSGNLRALSGGISEALITTQGGLLVAIPGLVIGALLRRQAAALRARVDAFCLAAGRELAEAAP